MIAFVKNAALSLVVLSLVMIQPNVYAAKLCKGLSKSSCNGNAGCSWINSYKTKTGTKVDAYCRTKPKKAKASVNKAHKDVKKMKSPKASVESKSKKNKAAKKIRKR